MQTPQTKAPTGSYLLTALCLVQFWLLLNSTLSFDGLLPQTLHVALLLLGLGSVGYFATS